MERITVNMSPTAMLETCHASQFDVGVQKRFDLVDGSSAYTLTGAETITLKIRTPDGTLVESNVPNTSDSYVIWTSGAGELDAFGICLCSIHVTNGSDELGSGNFIMEVEADPYNGKNIRIVTVGPADICTFETTLLEPYPSVTVNVLATGGYDADTQTAHPINGYSSANITRCGVNLFDYTQTISSNMSCTNGVFTNTATDNQTVFRFQLQSMLDNSVVSLLAGGNISTTGKHYYNFTFPSNCNYLMIKHNGGQTDLRIKYPFTKQGSYTISFNVTSTDPSTLGGLSFKDVQIEVGSQASDFAPYNSTTVTIAFGQTVYGGVLDVTRGKIHGTHKIVDLGDLNWVNENDTQNGLCRASAQFTDCVWQSVMICSAYNYNSTTSYNGLSNGDIALTNSESIPLLRIRNTDYSTYTNAQIKTAVTGVKLVYQTKTPFDIDLTPVQIRALVGENNVFADCGQTTVQYLDEE